jgi:NAD+ synthase
LVEFLRKSEANGYVVALSGGLDSSTAATLAVRAVGKEKVFGLILPDPHVTPNDDVSDAEALAKELGIQTYFVDLAHIITIFTEATPFFNKKAKIANGNLRARIRMCLLYYFANSKNFLVLGTGDRSEILIGYFTKYGDGATDLLPLGDLYKTEVRQLAGFLKLPFPIVSKPSSPHLWIGHSATEELGMPYDIIDRILHGYFDLKISPSKIAQELDLPISKIRQLLERNRMSEHKRKLPPIIKIRNQRKRAN